MYKMEYQNYTLDKNNDSIIYFSKIVWNICLEDFVENFEDYIEVDDIKSLSEDEISELIVENGVDFYSEANIMIRESPEDFINDNIKDLNRVIESQLNDIVLHDIMLWDSTQKSCFINQLFKCVVDWCESNITDFGKQCSKEILSNME